MKFSVLMSIYSATKATDLDRCLNSLSQQTMPATEIIIVRDGMVHSSVEHCIQTHTPYLPFRHLSFQQNRGLGPALRDGLKACNYELVARVDSDDWSLPTRFQKQTQYLNNQSSISLVGSWLREHHHVRRDIIPVIRRSPSDHISIKKAAKRRNPINHPTVMFRKSDVLACDSYESYPLFEDYYLWVKMLTQGFLFSNLSEVLVETEVGSDYFRRRGGLMYVKNEFRLARRLQQIGFLSLIEASAFLISRLPARLAPVVMRRYLYRAFLRKT